MTPECSELSDILHKESAAIAGASNDSSWAAVESAARALGDALRVKDGPDNHTALGKTNLPTDLNNLLTSALEQHLPNGPITAAAFELMRVGANMCMDHGECVFFHEAERARGLYLVLPNINTNNISTDGNREQLQDSGFLMSVVKVLEHYAETIPSISKQTAPLPLSIPQLKVVKTAIGVLLNATIGYEPVRSRLMALEAAITILRLSTSIYPPGRWASVEAPLSPEDPTTNEALVESWNIRSGLSGWSWRFISELKGGDDGEEEAAAKSPNPQPLLGPDGLPLLIRQLSAFIPPYPQPKGPYVEPASRRHLVAADAECLEEACTLLEALCLDAEDIRLSFARGLSFPDGEHGGVKCIEELCNFLEHGDYPVYWSDESEQEQARRKKTFDFCKAALVKALVEVAGEDKNTDVLWDNSESEKPGGAFVWAMVSWIRNNKVLGASGRDDLIICSTLCLGNIARREAHSAALLQPPISLGADLADLLQPDADLKVKHGVIGLLKHLAQAATNRTSLGKAGVLPRLATSGIWGEKADMAEIIQVSAIGVAKHLCNGNAENVYELVLPKADQESEATALAQILALIRRSDSMPVKSEGTRVLVNAIKSVWSPDAAKGTQRSEAMAALLDLQCASALAQMVARSKKYPILINEGVVALTLLSTHAKGGNIVFTALTSQLPEEVGPRGASIVEPTEAETSGDSPPATAPTSALEGLYTTLKNRDEKVAPEVRANICALLGQLGRDGVVDKSESEEVAKLKEKARPLLEEAGRTEKNSRGNTALATAASSALQAWKSPENI